MRVRRKIEHRRRDASVWPEPYAVTSNRVGKIVPARRPRGNAAADDFVHPLDGHHCFFEITARQRANEAMEEEFALMEAVAKARARSGLSQAELADGNTGSH